MNVRVKTPCTQESGVWHSVRAEGGLVQDYQQGAVGEGGTVGVVRWWTGEVVEQWNGGTMDWLAFLVELHLWNYDMV